MKFILSLIISLLALQAKAQSNSTVTGAPQRDSIMAYCHLAQQFYKQESSAKDSLHQTSKTILDKAVKLYRRLQNKANQKDKTIFTTDLHDTLIYTSYLLNELVLMYGFQDDRLTLYGTLGDKTSACHCGKCVK